MIDNHLTHHPPQSDTQGRHSSDKVQCHKLAIMATTTERVKESLLGVEEDPNMAQPNRSSFMQHAIKDEQTGEEYLNEQGFINAIAPEGEDYVSTTTT